MRQGRLHADIVGYGRRIVRIAVKRQGSLLSTYLVVISKTNNVFTVGSLFTCSRFYIST